MANVLTIQIFVAGLDSIVKYVNLIKRSFTCHKHTGGNGFLGFHINMSFVSCITPEIHYSS